MSADDDYVKISGKGIAANLSNGASVAGFTSECGSFAWLFTRKDVKTPLALSKEAMEAVIDIYGQLITGVHRGEDPPGQHRWVLVREKGSE